MDETDGDHPAAPRPVPGSLAPWERWRATPQREADYPEHLEYNGNHAGSFEYPAYPEYSDAALEPEPGEPYEEEEPTGSHASGALSVADLLARFGDTPPPRRRRRAARPDPEPEPEPEPELGPAFAEETDSATEALALGASPTADCRTEVFGVVNFDELPDLNRLADPEPPPAPPRARRFPLRIGPRRPQPSRPRRTRRRSVLLAGRTLAALIAVLSLALTGGAWQWSASKNNSLTKISALDPDSRDIIDINGQFGDENFLIVGVDTRLGDNSYMGAGDTEDAGGARSDSIMLVNIPANRQRVVAVSFPRDLAITPMYCEAWNPETAEYGPLYDEASGTYSDDWIYTETKLNSTFAFGGPKCLVKAIQKLSGLNINRFLAIDFSGFAKMVDALGGVEVCTTSPLEDYELGTVLAHAGRQRIDGGTALNYVRARQVTTEINGDYGRIKRQQLFLSSLLRSLISSDTFFSLKKLNNVVNMFIADSYVDNVTTKDLVELGQSVQGVSAGHVTFVTVPTGETDENGDEPPRTADMRALFTAIIDDDPLPGEDPAAPTSSSAAPDANPEQIQATSTDPDSVTVQVSNSTDSSGLAAQATDALEPYGFSTLYPNDYPTELDTTTVFFSPGNEHAAVTLASAFPGAKIKRDTGKGRVVQVVLGSDYHVVVPPAPSGTPVSVPLSTTSMSPPTELPEDLTVTNAADTSCE
ncbi:LCP family protein [Mycobacterium sp. 1274756.6]|uniref:LCP family protein n=1 Tax=Mycobacterium sp. 1274756.6 TaxID=1834076 RepID=UPI0009ED6F02|nr:LCP family protein [Mycobacterium sp. 1274756.6]